MATKKNCRNWQDRTAEDTEAGNTEMSLADRIRARRRAWTAEELSELLSMSKKAIYGMCRAGRIPHIRVGALIRFDSYDLGNWLESKAA